ncbi:hypothetical protein SAMN05660865_01591 [Caloramator fervidus]|uniref:Uncharacterized protein n=1 Tax=Caloramator fervidus TaxID=29344 RepID=A0A1H5WUT5_9CLOT|nr:hypothetical protein [Caloramator fervidus]SEG03252.1 hypothetical protein SAMN05660865_01591 [Caloramator fervidus]
MVKYLLYVFLVAIITMILTYIGYLKDAQLSRELLNVLYIKSRRKIIDYLNKNKKADVIELQKIIKDVKGKVFWSRKQVKINQPEKFIELLIDDLYKKDIIDIEFKRGRKIVSLKNYE